MSIHEGQRSMVKGQMTNLGKTREEVVYELLLSLNQGNCGYVTSSEGAMPRIDLAIAQYDALVKRGVIKNG